MTTRRYEDDLVSDFHRRVWPVIDVRSRIERAARTAETPASPSRRSA
jgi:hypothetical protein